MSQRFYQGEFSGTFASLDGGLEVELELHPQSRTFRYRDPELGPVEGSFRELEHSSADSWALLELVRGRERTRLLVRKDESGIELHAMQSVREQLMLLPVSGSLELSR